MPHILAFRRFRHPLAILAGALTFCWPAFLNRYPLLFPDSVTYLGTGAPIARALFLHRYAGEYGMRSLIYSLGILPLHWLITPWPIVFFNALIMAYVLWLVVRSLLPRDTAIYYLGIVIVLSALTSVSWYVSFIMPDVFGATLYLAIYLVVFARDTLSRSARIILALIACWSAAAHATHFMLGTLLCVTLILLLALRRRYGRALAEVAAILIFTAAAQIALNSYLYGQPVLDARRPPYLAARVLGDGPGRDYLMTHCPQANLTLCANVEHLPTSDDEFLWADDSIWENASPERQQQLRSEEMPFVLATLRAYPRQQLTHSLDNAWQQLINFDINDFDANTWMDTTLAATVPAASVPYRKSLQARNALPEDSFSTIQFWAVIVSLAVVLLSLPIIWRHHNTRLLALSFLTLFIVLANGVLTAVLSGLDGRYQARVIWLIPLIALLMLADHISLSRRRIDLWSSSSTTTTASPTTSSNTWAS